MRKDDVVVQNAFGDNSQSERTPCRLSLGQGNPLKQAINAEQWRYCTSIENGFAGALVLEPVLRDN